MKKVKALYLIVVITILTFSIRNESYAKENDDQFMLVNNQYSSINHDSNTPVSTHGKLSVKGTDIVDQNGNKFQLRGVSTHGIQWFSQYVNQDAFIHMRDKWGINAIRLAMYSNPGDGYSTQLHEIVKNGVEYAKNAGLYVIIDWHILNDNNPNINKDSAIKFFQEMANLYKDDVNVIYEICNEPNGDVQWERDIKPYAEEVIKEIRNIDNDAIIVVGTPTWSQDVDVVAKSPIAGYDNIMYTLHFYATTHKDYLREKLRTALNSRLPVFVTEFGICDASGNGNLDIEEANTWIKFLNDHNISWMCWNLSNKNESSSLLNSNTNKVTGWTTDELSEGGRWLLEALKQSDNNSNHDNNNDNQDNNNNNTDDNQDNNNNNTDDNQDSDNNNNDNQDNNNNNTDNNQDSDNNSDNQDNNNNNNDNQDSDNNNDNQDNNNNNNNNDHQDNNKNNVNDRNDNYEDNQDNSNYANNLNNNSGSTNKFNNTIGTTSEGSINNNVKEDHTLVNGNLPKTGLDYYIYIPICLISILIICSFIKSRRK